GEAARSGLPVGFIINSFALSRSSSRFAGSSLTSNWSFAFTKTLKTFRSDNLIGSGGSSDHGGNLTVIPLSLSIVAVIRKKMSNRNAISAMDPAFTSGVDLLFDAIIQVFHHLKILIISPTIAIRTAPSTIMKDPFMKALIH